LPLARAGPRGKSENGVYYPKSLLSWEFRPNFLRLSYQVYLAEVYYLWVYHLGGPTVNLKIQPFYVCKQLKLSAFFTGRWKLVTKASNLLQALWNLA